MHSPRWNEISIAAHAWQLHPENIPARTLSKTALNWLEPHEHAHLRKLRKNLQHDHLAARALCRLVLSYYTTVGPADWKFKPATHGKPTISQPRAYSSVRFNLTHTDSLIICLVTRTGEVGVDVERTNRRVDIDEIVRHFFAATEQRALAKLAATERTKRFFEIWVLKEAYLKGRGRGLSISPARVPIRFDAQGSPIPIGDWQLELHCPTPHHVAATAIHRTSTDPTVPIVWRNAAQLFKA